ncbi:UNVERIFIED_CONTAM: hypothetical protein Sradi_2038600 [Sesamum radiatum]|uniref:Uncharacterized protein n=1 Tax=Sesamum radiatum TaxID=300843 RepID=A0AAW2TGD0_SESRA
MRIGPFEGLGDFQTLAGPGRLANAGLSPYTTGGMLGRLNTPANVNLRNLTPSALLQPTHAQNITALGEMHPILPPTNQNPSLFQGMPSSLELDQLQQNKCSTGIVNFNAVDDSRMYTASNAFTDTGAAIGSSTTIVNAIPGNPLMLHGNSQQTLSGGGFGSHSSHNMASFSLESLTAGVNGSSSLLDPGSIESCKVQPNSVLSTDPFHSQLPLNGVRQNNFSNSSYLHNNPVDISSTTMTLPFEDSREVQCQESLVGNVQNITQTPSQKWCEQGQNYSHSSKTMFGSSDSYTSANGSLSPFSRSLGQDSEIFNQKTGMLINSRSTGGGSNLMQKNENEKLATASRARSNDNFLVEQPKSRGGFVPRSYDSLDAMMNAMIKRGMTNASSDICTSIQNFTCI